MKRLIHAPTFTLAYLSTLSIAFFSPSVQPTVHANERSCPPVLGTATTGGAIRQQLEAIARCNATDSTSNIIKTSVDPTKATPPLKRNLNIDEAISEDSVYPTYCPGLPRGVKPGDLGFREALERCKYGS
ncbi:MAG: hypothetical protein OHK0047_01600 [Leptolyngbyaceae cyanobacterium]